VRIPWNTMNAIEIRETEQFSRFLLRLRDSRARARIQVRIRRLSLGLLGDAKSIGGGVYELRVDHGPGYRVYFVSRGTSLIVLLAGGDKGSQERDIALARTLARDV
jgi:putative addiction module killer protein